MMKKMDEARSEMFLDLSQKSDNQMNTGITVACFNLIILNHIFLWKHLF